MPSTAAQCGPSPLGLNMWVEHSDEGFLLLAFVDLSG